MKEKTPIDTVRVDRWLSAARFYKTRSQAARACEGGKVKVNGSSAKPHKFLHVGDKLTIHVRDRYYNLEVLALAQRGLSAVEASKLYVEEERQTLSAEAEELLALYRETNRRERSKYKGRPTKKERRKIDKHKDNFLTTNGH
jgi:ribosome-associated heat shock protein Hsp15